MKGISSFFDKFNNVAIREIKKREIISFCIESVVKQKVEIKDIHIREGILTIKGNQALKSEIFLKKKRILDLICQKGSVKIVDIK
jgi:hypothetical protein